MLIMYLTVPYFLIKQLFLGVLYPKPNHALHRGQTNNGHKHIVISKDYSLEAIRSKCKEIKASIHELLLTAISVSMKEYLISKGDEKT